MFVVGPYVESWLLRLVEHNQSPADATMRGVWISIAISFTTQSACLLVRDNYTSSAIFDKGVGGCLSGGSSRRFPAATTKQTPWQPLRTHATYTLVMKYPPPCRLHTWRSVWALVMVDQAATVDKDAQKASFCVVDNAEFWAAGIYRPLDPTKKEIRILRILPAAEDGEIVCELEQNISLLELPKSQQPAVVTRLAIRRVDELAEPSTDLIGTTDDASMSASALQKQWYLLRSKFECHKQIPEGAEYFGLSYAVGEVTEPAIIMVAGLRYKVSRNLAQAIQHLRRMWHGAVLRIWIDQICINQNNIHERGHQVKMMSNIYRTARGTVTWLGDDDGGNEMMVCDTLDRLNALLPKLSACGLLDTYPQRHDVEVRNEALAELEEILKPPEVSKSLLRLFSQPFWSRVWVVQEALLSQGTLFVYGSLPLGFELTQGVINALGDLRGKVRGNCPSMKAIWGSPAAGILRKMPRNRFNAATVVLGSAENRYSWILSASRELKASDRRDCVYGMLGFLSPGHGIVPDYSEANTAQDTFMLATKKIIEHDRNLEVLHLCCKSSAQTMLDLPSWVPDFTRDTTDEHGSWSVDLLTSDRLFELEKCIPLQARFLAGAVLECTVKLVGPLATRATISRVFPDLQDSSDHDDDSALFERQQIRLLHFMQACASLVAIAGLAGSYAPTGEAITNALVSCLGGGLSARESRPSMLALDDIRVVNDGNRSRIGGGRWCFFVSPDGLIGLAPRMAKSTDILALLFDSQALFVLRPLRKEWGFDFEVVGTAYVHGADVIWNLQKLRRPGFRHQLRRIRIH